MERKTIVFPILFEDEGSDIKLIQRPDLEYHLHLKGDCRDYDALKESQATVEAFAESLYKNMSAAAWDNFINKCLDFSLEVSIKYNESEEIPVAKRAFTMIRKFL